MKSNSEIALTWNIKQNDPEVEVTDVENCGGELESLKKELTAPVPKQGGRNNFK